MLKLQGYIPIPPHTAGEFDHGDVHLASGRVFVAHTGANTVEVLDGERMSHAATLPCSCYSAREVVVRSAVRGESP